MTVDRVDIDTGEFKQPTGLQESTSGDDKPMNASADRAGSKDSMDSTSGSGLYLCVSRSDSRRIELRPEDLEGVPPDLVKELDQDGDHHITFQEVIREASKCRQAEHHTKLLRRIVMVLFIGVCFTVALNSVCTIFSIEATKEAHVNNQQMTDRSGLRVRVASSDTKVKGDGQLCPLSETGECLSGIVKTGEGRSYATLFDLPLFDSKTLSSLRELTLLLRDGQELTLTIVGNMKHKGGKSATFYAHSGSKVVIDGTTMTALAFVEGQSHVVDNPKRLRRLQEGGRWQPQLYDEQEFFTAENGFDVIVDAKGRRLRRRLNADSEMSGWASLAMSIAEAVVGYYENEGRQIQHHASITGKLIIRTLQNGVPESDVGVDMAILYNKTVPSHSRLFLATGGPNGQAWLTAYGQSMEFAYSGGALQSCEVLSSPSAPELIASAVTVGANYGMLAGIVEMDQDGTSYHITIQIDHVYFDNNPDFVANLQVPDTNACPESRRLEAPADRHGGGWEYSGNGTLSGRRLADVAASVGWNIAKATYGLAGWQSAHGDRAYVLPSFPQAGWEFETKDGECTTSHSIAKILLHADKQSMAVSFVEFEDLHDVVLRAANRDSTIIGYVQNIIANNTQNLFPCLEKKLSKHSVKFLIGHGIGGSVAVSYFHNQGGQGRGFLTGDAVVVTYGAPPTGPDECDVPGTRYHHVNDAVGSDLLSTEDHEMAVGKVYDDTSPRRRWMTWDRRRRTQWQWTDNCERKTSDSFSNVEAVLAFNDYTSFFR